jgi:hypothetical protein
MLDTTQDGLLMRHRLLNKHLIRHRLRLRNRTIRAVDEGVLFKGFFADSSGIFFAWFRDILVYGKHER